MVFHLLLSVLLIAAFKYAQKRRRWSTSSGVQQQDVIRLGPGHSNCFTSCEDDDFTKSSELEMKSNDDSKLDHCSHAAVPESETGGTTELFNDAKTGEIKGDATSKNKRIRFKYRNLQDALEVASLKGLLSELREREAKLQAQLSKESAVSVKPTRRRDVELDMERQLLEKTAEINKLHRQISAFELETSKIREEIRFRTNGVEQADLDLAHERIKAMQEEIMDDASHTKAQLLVLKEQFSKLQEATEARLQKEEEMQQKLCRATELQVELSELQRTNKELLNQNTELGQRLVAIEKRAAKMSMITEDDIIAAEAEASELRSINNKLTKEVESLQITRFTEVEELVYLRWVNACLQHNLDMYKASQKTPAVTTVCDDADPHHENREPPTLKYLAVPWMAPHAEVEVGGTPRSGNRLLNSTRLAEQVDERSPSSLELSDSEMSSRNSSLQSDHKGISRITMRASNDQYSEGRNLAVVNKPRRHSSSLLDQYLHQSHASKDIRILKQGSLRLSSSSSKSVDRWRSDHTRRGSPGASLVESNAAGPPPMYGWSTGQSGEGQHIDGSRNVAASFQVLCSSHKNKHLAF